jgi:hypothetical protein
MEHRIEHDLSPELARKAVTRAVESYSQRFEKYDPSVKWQGEDQVEIGFTAKGIKLAGKLRLEPKAVVVDMDVPLLLRPFRAKAMEVIEGQVKAWVEKAKTGEI